MFREGGQRNQEIGNSTEQTGEMPAPLGQKQKGVPLSNGTPFASIRISVSLAATTANCTEHQCEAAADQRPCGRFGHRWRDIRPGRANQKIVNQITTRAAFSFKTDIVY